MTRAERRDVNRAYWEKLRARGVCTKCKQPMPDGDERWLCPRCRGKASTEATRER
jgi:Zn finger protein HypA/HybF involved in hydrogenase expression